MISFARNMASLLRGASRCPMRTNFSAYHDGSRSAAADVLNSAKAAGVHVPGVLPGLKNLYAAALGKRLFVSLIVLKPLAAAQANGTYREALMHMIRRHNGSAPRSPFLVRTVRTQPYLYSAICKARLFYSRRIAGAEMRACFSISKHNLFAMNDFESRQVEALRRAWLRTDSGFLFHGIRVRRLYARADRNVPQLFKLISSGPTPSRPERAGVSKACPTRNSPPRKK